MAKPLTGRGTWRSQFAPDAVFAGASAEQQLYIHYLAVLCLLGRVCGQTDRYSREVERAFEDANVILKARNSDSLFERCSPGGYSLFQSTEK